MAKRLELPALLEACWLYEEIFLTYVYRELDEGKSTKARLPYSQITLFISFFHSIFYASWRGGARGGSSPTHFPLTYSALTCSGKIVWIKSKKEKNPAKPCQRVWLLIILANTLWNINYSVIIFCALKHPFFFNVPKSACWFNTCYSIFFFLPFPPIFPPIDFHCGVILYFYQPNHSRGASVGPCTNFMCSTLRPDLAQARLMDLSCRSENANYGNGGWKLLSVKYIC